MSVYTYVCEHMFAYVWVYVYLCTFVRVCVCVCVYKGWLMSRVILPGHSAQMLGQSQSGWKTLWSHFSDVTNILMIRL